MIRQSRLFVAMLILLTVFTFFLVICEESTGTIITVDKNGNGDYETIQEAIENAIAGDTIEVWEGEYQENVEVNKNVDLVGNGSEVTTIHGGWQKDVVNITSDWVNMSGFKLIHGGERTPNSMIRIESDYNHIFENYCEVEKGYGIGLFEANDNILMNNIITENEGISIFLEGSQWNTAHTNELWGSKIGVMLVNSDDNGIYYNNCSKTTVAGIQLQHSTYNSIRFNNVSQANAVGMNLLGSSFNVIGNNSINLSSTGLYFNIDSDHNSLEGNSVTHCDVSGITISESNNNSISENIITRNLVGIQVGLQSYDNDAHYNNISNNLWGVSVGNNNERTFNASFNWWGSDTGPYHASTNSDGQGDNVTDYVIFEPWTWMGNKPPTAIIDSITPDPVVERLEVRLIGSGVDDGTVVQYAWRSSIDGEFYNGTETDITYSEFSPGSHNIYLRVKDDLDVWSDKALSYVTVVEYLPPIATIISITPSEVDLAQPVVFVGHGSSLVTIVQYAWSSDIDGTFYTGPDPQTINASLSIGTHDINLKVQDELGEWSEEANKSLTISGEEFINFKPTVMIDQPHRYIAYQPSSTKLKGIVHVSGTAADENGNETIVSVEVNINYTGWELATYDSSIGQWYFSFDSREHKDGLSKILARSFDGLEYSGTTKTDVYFNNNNDDDDENSGPCGSLCSSMTGMSFGIILLFQRRKQKGLPTLLNPPPFFHPTPRLRLLRIRRFVYSTSVTSNQVQPKQSIICKPIK